MTTIDQEPPTLGNYGGHEIYPMPAFATLAVADVAAVAAWYERALGFSTVFATPASGGQPTLVHLRRRKYQDLLLVPAPPAAVPSDAPSSLTLSFGVAEDVDGLAERARAVTPLGRSSIAGPSLRRGTRATCASPIRRAIASSSPVSIRTRIPNSTRA